MLGMRLASASSKKEALRTAKSSMFGRLRALKRQVLQLNIVAAG